MTRRTNEIILLLTFINFYSDKYITIIHNYDYYFNKLYLNTIDEK